MKSRSRRAATLGGATFLLALGFGVATIPAEEVEEAPAPAGALNGVAKMNADANAVSAERARRQASAL